MTPPAAKREGGSRNNGRMHGRENGHPTKTVPVIQTVGTTARLDLHIRDAQGLGACCGASPGMSVPQHIGTSARHYRLTAPGITDVTRTKVAFAHELAQATRSHNLWLAGNRFVDR